MDKKKLLELLEQYEAMQLEIKKLEKRIERYKKQSEMVSDVVQNGYKRHAIIYGFDYTRQDRIDRLEELLKDRYDSLLECQTQVEEFLDTLQSDIRQILQHRYIDGMSWIQIQIAMRYESESKARMKHDRFFEKI